MPAKNRPRHVERLRRELADCQCCALYLAIEEADEPQRQLGRAIDICYRCQRDICDRCLGANDRWYQICHQCRFDESYLKDFGERLYDYPLHPINLARVKGSGPIRPRVVPIGFERS